MYNTRGIVYVCVRVCVLIEHKKFIIIFFFFHIIIIDQKSVRWQRWRAKRAIMAPHIYCAHYCIGGAAAVAVQEAAITTECKKLNIDPFGEPCFSGRKTEREKNKTFQ